MSFLTKAFGFDPKQHNVRTEIVAGITTFLTMAYILAVNPSIFSALPGMPQGSVFTATAVAAIIGCLMMAFYAKKPFGLAPGMGLNAFFVFTVCLTMGYSWQFALTAVLIEGIIFIILTVTRVRSWLVDAIPGTLKKAIGAGIGLFIAFIGLQGAGIIINSDATLVTLGDITHGKALLGLIGLAITAGLVMAKVRGGILIGILATTALGLIIKDPETGAAITTLPSAIVSLPDSVSPIFCKFEWSQIFTLDMLVVVFTFLFIDMFDTMGTLIGVCQGTELGENDKIDGLDKMFMADAVATVAGACLGTSTTTTYVESASGVGAGGRTGLTAFSIACCFILTYILGYPERSNRSGTGYRRCNDDALNQGHPLGRFLKEHPRIPHRHHHASGIFHLRWYPYRCDCLCGYPRHQRQVQRYLHHDVGTCGTLRVEIHFHINYLYSQLERRRSDVSPFLVFGFVLDYLDK